MPNNRRKFIKQLLSITAYSVALSGAFTRAAFAATLPQKEKFLIKRYNNVLENMYNKPSFIVGRDKITFSRLPDVAENGASVPITITTTLKNVDKIAILVERNPYPLSAEFYLSLGVYPKVSARLKMAKSSNVVVVVEAEGKLYRKTKFVKVTVGGCG
jgi:sulfur-oxidizing protein SoxY